jgi:hypothetical protein
VTSPRSLVIILAWIPLVLALDGRVSTVILGVVTTALLFWLTAQQPVIVRYQVAIVVAFATVIEVVFSGWLGTYEYRLGMVPLYVPAGHGLVYLAALDVGDWKWARRHQQVLVRLTVLVVVAVALYALMGTRNDVLGAFWAVCLLGFLKWGRAPLLFVGAFWVVSWLEILGTRWGVWTWQPYDTIVGWVPQGNPPSVAAGGYGWFDLAAVAFAGWLAVRVQPWFANGRTWSWSRPLVVTAHSADRAEPPSQPVILPPASSTTGTNAAMSHRFSAGSAVTSTLPSATKTCDQKSP